MKKVGCLVIFVVLAVVMVVTNPSQQAHIDNAYQILKEQGIDDFGIDPNYIAIGEGLLGKEGMDKLMTKFITRNNYYLFSITQIEFDGQKHSIAIGMFGTFFDIGDAIKLNK